MIPFVAAARRFVRREALFVDGVHALGIQDRLLRLVDDVVRHDLPGSEERAFFSAVAWNDAQ